LAVQLRALDVSWADRQAPARADREKLASAGADAENKRRLKRMPASQVRSTTPGRHISTKDENPLSFCLMRPFTSRKDIASRPESAVRRWWHPAAGQRSRPSDGHGVVLISLRQLEAKDTIPAFPTQMTDCTQGGGTPSCATPTRTCRPSPGRPNFCRNSEFSHFAYELA
jgi:hypothetical protein